MVQIPFAAPGDYPGDARWLGISVRSNGVGSFIALRPLQQLTPTPYSLFSSNAATLGGQTASYYAPATGSTAYVAKAGDTMTGTLNLCPNGLVAGTSQLVISGGNVGIGTVSPAAKLQVAGDAYVAGTNFSASGQTAQLILGDFNHTVRSIYGSGLRLGVWPYPNALVVQDNSGNVGIGTATPAAKLEVNGAV